MKFLLRVLFVVVLATVGAFAQIPSPSASPPPPVDSNVVRISTDLIQIDVTVTDSRGKAITDLSPDEIEIFENGKKQKITNFSFNSTAAASNAPAEKAKVPDKDNVPLTAKVLRRENVRRTMALVVDDLSLSWESAIATRKALKKFVDEQMESTDLVAIIETGAGVGALQQFTSDKRALYAAIDHVKWNPVGYGETSAFAGLEPTLLQQRKALGDASISMEDIQEERSKNNAKDDERASVFASGTLGALAYVVAGMSELPGRKTVVMFSEGFRLTQRDDYGLESGGRVASMIKKIIDLANRSSVVIYTVDARGAQTTAFSPKDLIVIDTPDEISQSLATRTDHLRSTQEGLTFLAKETGGMAVINNNDLTGGLLKVLEDKSYYLVGYVPDEETFDPAVRRYNQLEVKVSRPGAKVRYRSGFFNVATAEDNAAPAVKSPVQQLKAALTSPFAAEGVTVRLNALFGNDQANGSYVRSLLHIDASDLTFTDEKDGMKKVVFDVLAVSFGENGQAADQIAKTYTFPIKPEIYERLRADGFVYDLVFPVKDPGTYQYRMAIRDTVSGRIGSASQFIEVPNLKKKQLTLSGIALVSYSPDQWNRRAASNDGSSGRGPIADTALRRIKSGSVLQYGYDIYNAKPGPSKHPNLNARIRIFRDGKIFLDGTPHSVPTDGQKDLARIHASGAIEAGRSMVPGDYILQVVVTDENGKQLSASQFLQFEVVQ